MQRRARATRTPTGKSLLLTDRDHGIFEALARYRYLRSSHLYAFAGGASEKRFKERLGDLFHEGYLDRPAQQWEQADCRHVPAVYELGARGRAAFGEPPASVTFLAQGTHRQFTHSLLSCAALASFELAASRRGLRFIGWPEILAKTPEETRRSDLPQRIPVGASAVIPDGLFGLEYGADGAKSYRFFALELDRGTMPLARSNDRQTSYLAKLGAYREVIASGRHKAHWGIPNLLVLSVMLDERRVSAMLSRLQGSPLAAAFLFRAIDPRQLNAPCPGLLAEPWLRPGLDQFAMGASA